MSRGAVRPPFIEAVPSDATLGSEAQSRGAVRPPFIEARLCQRIRLPRHASRGAVRPPFIEAGMCRYSASACLCLGGQSAPPSLKLCYACRVSRNDLQVSGGSPPPLH